MLLTIIGYLLYPEYRLLKELSLFLKYVPLLPFAEIITDFSPFNTMYFCKVIILQCF